MEISLADLARRVDGVLRGDPERKVSGVAPFESATEAEVTYAALPKLLRDIDATGAAAVIVPAAFQSGCKDLVCVENPAVAMAKAMALFHPRRRPAAGISSMALLGSGTMLGEGVSIGAFVYVGRNVAIGDRTILHPHVYIGDNVRIGEAAEIHPNVTIQEGCVIGNRVILHAGSVIGSDGYGYAQDGLRHHKIPQVGIVQIDDDVEIGACNTIDRAMFGKTWIKRGVKTDNLVHIAHNVTVGQDSLLVAQVGLSGSTTLGDNVVMAGKASTIPHMTIGDRAIIGAKAAVAKPVSNGEVISGTPGMPHRQWLRVQRVHSRLPELNSRVVALEKRLDRMAADLEQGATGGGEEK